MLGVCLYVRIVFVCKDRFFYVRIVFMGKNCVCL